MWGVDLPEVAGVCELQRRCLVAANGVLQCSLCLGFLTVLRCQERQDVFVDSRPVELDSWLALGLICGVEPLLLLLALLCCCIYDLACHGQCGLYVCLCFPPLLQLFAVGPPSPPIAACWARCYQIFEESRGMLLTGLPRYVSQLLLGHPSL